MSLPTQPVSNATLRAACGFFLGHQAKGDQDSMSHWAWRITRMLIARAMQ